MIIDTHCHIDMLPTPEIYLAEKERSGDVTLGMTNLPSHFTMGISHFKGLRKSRLALGFHPQLAKDNQHELRNFARLAYITSYIGEVGLDFSKDFVDSKTEQIKCFDFVCQCIQNTKKIVSVHSRRAEREVLETLKRYGIKNAIFHWYSGPLGLIDEILSEGYFFSINEAMTLSESGKKIISRIPTDRLLTESDAPFNRRSDIPNALSSIGVSETQVYSNFQTLIKALG